MAFRWSIRDLAELRDMPRSGEGPPQTIPMEKDLEFIYGLRTIRKTIVIMRTVGSSFIFLKNR